MKVLKAHLLISFCLMLILLDPAVWAKKQKKKEKRKLNLGDGEYGGSEKNEELEQHSGSHNFADEDEEEKLESGFAETENKFNGNGQEEGQYLSQLVDNLGSKIGDNIQR